MTEVEQLLEEIRELHAEIKRLNGVIESLERRGESQPYDHRKDPMKNFGNGY